MKTSLKQTYIKNLNEIKARRKPNRFKLFYKKFMIKNPQDNRKLHAFHLIVACCFYVDFFLTGFIISNYEFLNMSGPDDYFFHHRAFLDDPNSLITEHNTFTEHKINDFMDHADIYFIIISIQFLDIILNFLIMNN